MVLIFLFCGQVFGLVNPRGSGETHDIATWNLENFPLNENLTVNYLTLLINDLDLDLICVQEIQSVDDFQQLVSNLRGWDGIITPGGDFGFYSKEGILFDTETVSIGEPQVLFEDADFAFIRPPMEFPVTMHENGDTLEFQLIVTHLKAGGCYTDDGENLFRRQAACDSLYNYINRRIADGDQSKWMIAGDLNDTIEDIDGCECFTVFLDDPEQWIFLSQVMEGRMGYGSYIEGDRLIDHILVTRDLYEEEYIGGRTETLRLDLEWNANLYTANISDHRPVASYFPAVNLGVEETTETALPGNASLRVWPVPANGSISISIEVPQVNGSSLEIFDILGNLVDRILLDSPSETIEWSQGTLSSGIYLIRLHTVNGTLVKRCVLLR